jgi:TonB-linked SusC/RagA family outer membrane protein
MIELPVNEKNRLLNKQKNVMKKKLLLLIAAALFVSAQLLQAQHVVTGKVTGSDDNLPIPGVTVVLKDSSPKLGAVTDIDGRYSINLPDATGILVFSAVGMKEEERSVAGKNNISILMQSSTTQLGTVVVTAYGVAKRVTNIGAAANVEEEVITRQSGANVISNLQGTVPGVQIDLTSGSPGSSSKVQIRGLATISGASALPLYIVDGVPIAVGDYGASGGQTVDPLASLNPADIESISFLKDASATAIYGSRASNGVIVINTKKGKSGKATVNFGMRVGWNEKPHLRHNYKLLSKEDYLEMCRIALRNAGYAGTNTDLLTNFNISADAIANPATDWWDAITRKGLIQDYNFSVSGGSDKDKYYVSGSYFQDEGFIIAGGTERYTVRMNLNNTISKIFSLDNSLSGSYSRTKGSMSDTYYANPIMAARMNLPIEPIKNEDGTWNTKTSALGRNPVAMFTDEYHDVYHTDLYRLSYSPVLRAKILKDLYVQVKGTLDYTLSHGIEILNPLVDLDAQSYDGLHFDERYQDVTLQNTNTINWMPTWGKHSLNILLGHEVIYSLYTYNYVQMSNFPNYKLVYVAANGAEPLAASSGLGKLGLLSFFSNAEYSYDDKYYVSASVRGDASSRFNKENRWGVFYSVGGKYRISQENFMDPVRNWLQNLSVRISYGTTGNQDIGSYYPTLGLYGYSPVYAGNPGSAPAQLSNPNLKWETRRKFDVGFDALLFDRIDIAFDYYNDVVADMIVNVPISSVTGFTSKRQNFATMRNQGVEAMVNIGLMKTKKFSWSFNFNVSHNKNIVLKISDTLYSNAVLRQEGLPWNTIFVRHFGGIYSNTGEPYYILADGSYTTDISLAQKPENRIIAGSSDPDAFGGFGTKVEFYGVDISAQFIYSIGGVSFNDDAQQHEDISFSAGGAPSNAEYYFYENAWKQPGDIATLPAIVMNRSSNWFWVLWTQQHLNSMSYFKMRNLTVGYTLPRDLTKKAYMQNVRFYFTADNVFSIYPKSYRGYDTNPAGLAQDGSGFNYPLSKNFCFGLNITF